MSSLSISKYIYFYYLIIVLLALILVPSLFISFLSYLCLKILYMEVFLTSYPLINDIHLLKNNILLTRSFEKYTTTSSPYYAIYCLSPPEE